MCGMKNAKLGFHLTEENTKSQRAVLHIFNHEGTGLTRSRHNYASCRGAVSCLSADRVSSW
jgi:hypothetical protein